MIEAHFSCGSCSEAATGGSESLPERPLLPPLPPLPPPLPPPSCRRVVLGRTMLEIVKIMPKVYQKFCARYREIQSQCCCKSDSEQLAVASCGQVCGQAVFYLQTGQKNQAVLPHESEMSKTHIMKHCAIVLL